MEESEEITREVYKMSSGSRLENVGILGEERKQRELLRASEDQRA